MDPRVLVIKNLVRQKIQSPPTVGELAEKFNVSPSRLRDLFKNETGISFRKFVRNTQLNLKSELSDFQNADLL